jgi:rare lipoprotein A
MCAACGATSRGPRAPGPTGYNQPQPGPPAQPKPGDLYETGKATWYGGSLNGGPTASGERYDQDQMTAAHKHLPMNSIVRVKNLQNGREVEVRINDRGPYGQGRVIDVSRAAARLLDMVDAGVVPVELYLVKLGEGRRKRKH